MDVREALWELFDQMVAAGKSDHPVALRKGSDGLYWLERVIREHDYRQGVAVDGARGWLPVRSEITDAAGKTGMRYECSDLQQVADSLWLPFRYDIRMDYLVRGTRRRQLSSFVLSDVEVNVPIPERELDITFPNGTNVDDKIANLHYVVDRRLPRGHRQLTRVLKPSDIGYGQPLTEEDLRRAEEIAMAGIDSGALQNARASSQSLLGRTRLWLLLVALVGVIVLLAVSMVKRRAVGPHPKSESAATR